MRIQRSLKSIIGNISHRAIIFAGSSVVIITIAVAGVLLHYSQTSHAATPPDSCFAFNLGTGTIGGYYAYEANNPSNPACLRDVDIPSHIGGVAVTTIGQGAFNSHSLTSVSIPNTVTTIDYMAFFGNSFATLVIPNSVINIGDNAFAGNSSLADLTIGNSVASIGNSAFSYTSLISVVVPSSVTNISFNAFCVDSLTSFVVQGDPAVLGDNILCSGDNLQTISYNGITHSADDPMDDSCFGFDSLTGTINTFYRADLNVIKNGGNACLEKKFDLVIPARIGGVEVTSIGYYAFSSKLLTSVIIPSSVTAIGYGAFRSNNLTSIIIPDSVTTIGDNAFSFNQLTSLTLGNSVQTIGHDAFESNQLAEVVLPCSVESLASTAFAFQGGWVG